MKAADVSFVVCLIALVTSVAAYLIGAGVLGTVAAVAALGIGGAGLAMANDRSRHPGRR